MIRNHKSVFIQRPQQHRPARPGQALVEFAVVALVMYLLLAAILTFGHALYVAQGLQTAADLAAREISRTPLPVMTNYGEQFTFEEALDDPDVRERIFDEALLVIDLEQFYENFPTDDPNGPNIFRDLVPTLPLLNQQLVTMMIVDRPALGGIGGPDAWLLRYPGALLNRTETIEPPSGVSFADQTSPYQSSTTYKSWVATDFAVGIPIVSERAGDGVETIRWVPVVEEIGDNPFQITSTHRGIVALRINFPFQSASMSSFRRDENAPEFPFEPTVGRLNAADDGGVSAPAAPDGTSLTNSGLTQTLPDGTVVYSGTYGGQYGLGAQGALGSQALTGGRPVRPYRRVISAQAIYRREVFAP